MRFKLHFILLSLASTLAQGQVTGSAVGISLDVQPWGMDHANAARTGKTSYFGPTFGQIDWTRKLGGMPLGIACNRAGDAILGAAFYDAWWSNELYTQAYDRRGEIVWRLKVVPYDWGASQGVKSAPALDKAGNVLMNSGKGQLIRVNPSGDLFQTIQLNANATNDSAPALLKDGSVIQYQFTNLTKHNAQGGLVWSIGASSQTDAAVAPNGDVALGGVRTIEPHGSTDVAYYNANGTLRWKKTSTSGVRTQVCFGPDGILYTTVGGTTAYNPDGTVKWNQNNGGWGVCLDGLGRALVPQGNRVFAYNKDTGSLVWTVTLPFVGNVVQGLSIDGANKIYLSSTDGFVVCLNTDGSVAWNLKVCDQLFTQPSIAAGNALYVTGSTGFLKHNLFRIK